MNIFYLDSNPKVCAQMHNDKHVVKMILEYAQLLSTAHRILDGKLVEGLSKSGRKAKRYELPDQRDQLLYTATHSNHPSAVWCRQTSTNYDWLYALFVETCNEYTHRYGKVHVTDNKLRHALSHRPKNIAKCDVWSDPTPAMPDTYKVAGSGVESYRNYYLGDKREMSRWTNREMPTWFAEGINTLYGDTCYMEHKPKLNRIISMPLSQYANI